MSALNQSKSTPSEAEEKVEKINFVWTDEETALLIKIIIDYKQGRI